MESRSRHTTIYWNRTRRYFVVVRGLFWDETEDGGGGTEPRNGEGAVKEREESRRREGCDGSEFSFGRV